MPHRLRHLRPGTEWWPRCLVKSMAFESTWLSSMGPPQRLHIQHRNCWHPLRSTVEGRQLHDTAHSQTYGRLRQDLLCVHSIRGVVCSPEAAPDGFIKGAIGDCLNPRDSRRTLQPPPEVLLLLRACGGPSRRPRQMPDQMNSVCCFRWRGPNYVIECRTTNRAGRGARGAFPVDGCPWLGDSGYVTLPMGI